MGHQVIVAQLSRYFILVGGNLVSWKSKKQKFCGKIKYTGEIQNNVN